MLDVATLGFRIDSSQLRRAATDLGQVERQAERVEKSVKDMGRASVVNMGALRQAALGVSAAMGTLAGAFLAGGLVQASDKYVEMTNSLRVLGMTADQAAARINEIGEIAKRTRTPLEATAQLYQRVSIASRELGATQDQVLRFTENVGLALAQQGGSAEQASGALMQLSQALAGGVVRAEEFNSILEGAYPIAQAAANGIDAAGGSIGRLRQLMLDGQVSSKQFFDAILSQTTQLSAAFAGTVPTVGQAMQVLRDQWMLAVGQITGGTSTLSSAILKVADGVAVAARFINENMNQIIGTITAASVALTAKFIPAIYRAIVAVKLFGASLVTLRGALIATGIGAAVVAAGALIGKFLDLAQATGGFGNAMRALGDLAGLVWQGIINSAAAIPPGLAGVWNQIRAGFYNLVADLQRTWYKFLVSIGNALVSVNETAASVVGNAAERVGQGLDQSMASARDAAVGASAAYQEAGGVISGAFAPVAAKMAEMNKAIATAKGEAGSASEAMAGFGGAAGAAGSAGEKAGKKAAGGAKAAAAATKDLLAELHKELDAREQLIGLYGDERQRAEALQQVQQKLGDEIGRYSQTAIQGATDRIVAIEKEEEAWEGVMQRMESLTDGLASAWGDWLSGGLRDFKGFVSNILGSFKSMVSDMIAAAVRAPIGRALGAAMGMGGATSAFAGDPLSAALNTAMGGGGILSKIGTGIGTAISGAMSGFGSVFSGLFSGGLGGAAGAVTTALSGATSGLAGLATAAGAIAAPLAAVAAVFSFFKSKTTELDRGLRVTVDGMDALVETFRKTETRRFWGLSKKRRTNYDEASDEIADPIENAIGKVQQSVLDMAASIGTGSEAFTQFAYQFKLSTKDMTDEQALQAIQEEMGKFGDAFAAMIPDIADFAKEGEGIGATLERLSAALGTVNGVLGDLGLELYRVSVRGADAASQFADLFGGLDQFAQASSAYYEAFYSDAERFARLQDVSTKAIRDAGLAVPATREAYRRLVEAQDLSTEAGRKAAAVLIQLAPAFDQIYDAAEATRAAAAQAIADANASRASLLDSLLTDQQRAAQAQAEITATFAALNMTVPTTLDGLRAIIAGLDLTGEAGRDALARIAGIADALRDRLTPVQQAAERVTSGGGSSGRNGVAEERERLERQILQLQGNTVELRRRELAALNPANRALQEMVWRLEDAKAAMDSLSTDKFATLVDYELARSRQANSNAAPAAAASVEKKEQQVWQARTSEQFVRMGDYLQLMVKNSHRTEREIRELRLEMQEAKKKDAS